MQFKKVLFIGFICLVLLLVQAGDGDHVQASSRAPMADLLFTAVSFPNGSGHDFTVTENGLVLGTTAVYQSPILTAPIPFNALVPQWTANLPHLELLIRTGTAVDQMSTWTTLHPNGDWDTTTTDNQFVGEMISVPAQDSTHQLVQFAIHSHIATTTLSQLRLTFIDSTTGPTLNEMIAQQTARNSQQHQTSEGYPKPFVISRDVWCQDPACHYTNGLTYSPVTHLIVHHTKSDNATPDWPAHLRAIWNYHTFGLGWGDIGYNYLVDPSGNIFEGHLGGDDVVGIHANAANSGTMAVSLLGDFEFITPSDPMLNATANLLAWKADQRDINVYESANTLPNVAWGLPTLMGHRDVYGGFGTECPGQVAHALLPWLRDEVAARLGYVSPYIYVDELSGNFIKSDTNWFTAENQCGHDLHAYYTLTKFQADQSFYWGEWHLPIAHDGRYRLEAFIPFCNTATADTAGARYKIHHADGTDTVVINQSEQAGLWVSPGEYDFAADSDPYVSLKNRTDTDEDLTIWFDALRLLPLTTTAVPLTPTANTWLTPTAVTFQWDISHPDIVAATHLQAATQPDFATPVISSTWPTAVLSHTHTFTQSYPSLYWRVQLETAAGLVTSPVTHFHLDIAPPQSAVTGFYWLPAAHQYLLTWNGTDDAAGIASYTIDMRTAVTNTWQTLITGTEQTAVTFTPPTTDTIWFRSQATDTVGHREPLHPDPGDLNSTQVISLTHTIHLPLIHRP